MERNSIHLCFYPFLSSASKYVEESGASLENLISSAAFERARLRGKARILEAIKDRVIIKPAVITNAQAEMELLSYPFARILVSCIHDEHLVRRYVLSEAKAAHEKLLADSSTDSDIIYEMAEEFSIRVDFFREHVQMPFVDYLRFTANLHDKKWKLVNRGLEKGRVKLGKSEFIRIIQEAIYERIMKDLPLNVPADVCDAIRGYTEDIKRELEETRKRFGDAEGFIVKDPNSFPPCISHILSNLKEGINVTHGARFAVTAFLLNLGLSEDEIIEIYKNSPDFDEERTRYQVRHIAGGTGSVRYTAPSCATMRTYGNCIGSDDICEKISHPLNYYRLKLKTKKNRAQTHT
ncbi:MAG: DNA primase large subunit PriL [Euryarchaeota archaeon]|nr:DNA primase large subunit PriL [Euryarchaeota archaeon]